MKTLGSIVPSPPGWYARWRFGPTHTVSYPITVWALARDNTSDRTSVVGVDTNGLWPGGADERPGGEFVRYIYQPVEAALPDDVFNPVQSPSEPATQPTGSGAR
ncbi:hypothetical protein [Dactylosporangium sp. CA-139066]|uniref:hypothetical protein n=1 Tax=Dactylosporangium sp. CA-139066 TaxID=3239930 RepID=UPI003D9485AE